MADDRTASAPNLNDLGGLSEHDAHMENVQRSFDARAKDWSELYKNVRRVNDIVLIQRKELSVGFVCKHIEDGGNVLDVGCGAGWAAIDLAQRGYSVLGIDIAENMIELSRGNRESEGVSSDRCDFLQADIMYADLEEGSFDVMLLLGVIQYQVDEAPLLDRLRSLLKPGGIVVISGPIKRGLPNFFGFVAWAGRTLRKLGILRSPQPGGRTHHRYSLGRFNHVLNDRGFDLIDYVGYGFGDWVVIGRLIGFRGELILHRFFSWLAKFTPLGRLGNDMVIVGKKRG